MDDIEREIRRLEWVRQREEEEERCRIWFNNKVKDSGIELLPCWCGKTPEFFTHYSSLIVTRKFFDEDYDGWDKFYSWEPTGFSFGCYEHPTKKPGFTIINGIDYDIDKFKTLDGVVVYTPYIERADVNEWKKRNHVTGFWYQMYRELPKHDYEECPPSSDDIFDFVLEDWNRKVLKRREKDEAKKRDCPECGTHIWKKWTYCPNCGRRFD